ncbi:hypothetical protein [Hymenobacter wooponensis]|uniref:Uncharacterized protein n=1 Tax=Hymenobacter wooponensis TaxID=1525360 RepID=A0A4Z0MU59_9BACT|nr:hypothetical protein [Hymenobacter wooponensis]TGD82866.1 hypothetical protein EU557_03540 [Hymenobacter wooponensis]
MALKRIYEAYTEVSRQDDPQNPGVYTIQYEYTYSFWDDVAKAVEAGTQPSSYMGGYAGAPPEPQAYSWPTDTPLDAYTVPTDPAAAGYVAQYAGQYVTVYHDGAGGVTYAPADVCDLAIKNIRPQAPSGPGAPGSVSFEATTSAATVTVNVHEAASGAFVLSLFQVAPGLLGTNLAPGNYALRVQDAQGCQLGISPEILFTVPTAPALVVLGCMDEEATNYNPLATEDNGTCRYAPRWVGAWSPEGVKVTVAPAGDPLPAYLSAELLAGYPVGHPLAASRPLVRVALLRATVAPSGLATFDLAPYLRAELGSLQQGARRLDLNSATAHTSDLFVGFQLLVGGASVAKGYALNSALDEVTLELLRGSDLPLSPFGKTLPVWGGYDFPVYALDEDPSGRFGLVTPRPAANDGTKDIRVVNLPCPRYGLPVAWLAPGGGFGYWVFAGNHALGDEVGEGQSYLEATTQQLRYSSRTASRQVVEASSGVFSQRALAEGLRTLRRSVQAWYQPEGPGTTWVPITLKGGSFPAYREGRNRYEATIQFTEAVPQYVQGQ